VTKTDEQRSESRINQAATIFVEIFSSDEDDSASPQVIICNSIDISANGLQIQMDQDVAVGSILRLCVDMNSDEKEIYLVGEAKWVVPCDKRFNIGFELYDAENTDILGWKNTIANILKT
jgi:hypothetical protein